jgi:hypothetical protein
VVRYLRSFVTILLLLGLGVSVAEAVPARVKFACDEGGTGDTTIAPVFGSNVTANNLIIVATRGFTTAATITDTRGTAYAVATTSSGAEIMRIYYGVIPTTGANTVTTTWTGPNTDWTWVCAVEVSGLATANVLDWAGFTLTTGTSNMQLPGITTTQNEEYVFVAATQENIGTYTAGTNFSLVKGDIGTNPNYYGGIEDRVTTSTLTNYSAPIISSIANNGVMVGATFKSVDTGGGGPPPPGTKTVCASGCQYTSLQTAMNAAVDGDEIVISTGQVITESIVLGGAHRHTTPVIVRSSTGCPDRRMLETDKPLMATLRPGHPAEAIITSEGAQGWRFQCVNFESPGGFYNMVYTRNVALGAGTFRNTDNFVFDRIIMMGGEPSSTRNALYLNGSNITVTKSHIANIKRTGEESKAIVFQDGPGPATFTNNYLEAASINMLFGGGDQSSSAHIPNNITVSNNHLFKKPAWANVGYAIKNLFELKCATNVTVEDNIMENNFADAQNGTAVLFTVRNDDGNSPWATIQNVTFQRNTIKNTPIGVNFLGLNDGSPTVQGTNVNILNNLWITNGLTWLTAGGEFGTITIEYNTIFNSGFLMNLYESGVVWPNGGSQRESNYAINNLTYRNNLAFHNDEGVRDADGQGNATAALTANVNTLTWTHNVLANRTNGAHTYPGTNWYPSTATHNAEFNADYSLTPASTYNNASTTGSDLGWSGTVTITPPSSPLITTTTLPSATSGLIYNRQIDAAGGVQPNTFALFSGTLPTGMTLSTAGLLSAPAGNAMVAGTYNFVVRATESGTSPRTDDQAFVLIVNAPTGGGSITVTNAGTMPNATRLGYYCQQFAATGGNAPYTWIIQSGTPPTGLTMSPTGEFCGTPTSGAGNYNFVVRAMDVNAVTATKSMTVPVTGVPTGCNRTFRAGEVPVQGATFMGPNTPTGTVCVGDKWRNTSTNPAQDFIATTFSPGAVWVRERMPESYGYKTDNTTFATLAANIAGSNVTEVDVDGSYRMTLDLSGAYEMLIEANQTTAGAVARLVLQYSTTTTGNPTSWSTTNIYVPVSTSDNQHLTGAWVPIPVGIKTVGVVMVRIVVTNGNGSEAPAFKTIRLLAR